MKTRLLKKLRKKFEWHIHKETGVVTMRHRNSGATNTYKSIGSFVRSAAYDISMSAYLDHQTALRIRESAVTWRNKEKGSKLPSPPKNIITTIRCNFGIDPERGLYFEEYQVGKNNIVSITRTRKYDPLHTEDSFLIVFADNTRRVQTNINTVIYKTEENAEN